MKKIFLLMLTFLFFISTTFASKVHVLCYHTFLDKPSVGTDFSLTELRGHIKTFKDAGFKFVTLSDVMNGNIVGNSNILVTIDDGNHSVYPAYKQVFKPEGIKPALALYSNPLSKSKNNMTWEQVDELVSDGVEIIAHGFYSERLTDKLFQTNRNIFDQEIYSSKKIFEERYKTRIETFSYPNGVYSDSAIKSLKEAGYKAAFTIQWGHVKTPYTQNTNTFLLPRYMITRTHYKNQFSYIMADAKR